MKATISISTNDDRCRLYCLTEDAEAILADENAMFIDDLDFLKAELDILHPVPQGFNNQRESNYESLYCVDGVLTTDSKGCNIRVKGSYVVITDSLTASTTDLALIEKVAKETGVQINIGKEARSQLISDEEMKEDNFQVYPVGDFLVRPDYRGCSIIYEPKKAKSLKTKRANAAKKRVTTGQPHIDLLKDFRRLLCEIVEKHEVMEVLTFKAGTTQQIGTSRAELYCEIMQISSVSDILFGPDHLHENAKFTAKIEELLPYCEGLSSLKEQKVPEPYWDEDCKNKSDWNAKNKKTITKVENHNRSIKHANNFVKWLKDRACAEVGVWWTWNTSDEAI